MKQLLTLLGLVLVQFSFAQINTPQLISPFEDAEYSTYLFSEDEGHLFFMQENETGADILVLKENGSLWKTISAEQMAGWHYAAGALEFVQANGSKSILAKIVEASDPNQHDDYNATTYDVINDSMFSYDWPRNVSDTYFGINSIYENNEFVGATLTNYNTNVTREFLGTKLTHPIWREKEIDFVVIDATPNDLYVFNENLELIWTFSDEDYSVLGHWNDEHGEPFVLVKNRNDRVQVLDKSGIPIRGQAVGDSILFNTVDIYKSQQLGYIGVNNFGIYDLANFKLKVATPGGSQTIFSSNNKPYFLTENIEQDSFYLYDENTDLMHSFAKPHSLLEVDIDELFPTMHFFNDDRTIEFLQRLPQSSRLINEYNEILWEIPAFGIYLNGVPEFQYHKDIHVLYYKYNDEVYELPKIIDGEEYEFNTDPEPPIPPEVGLASKPHLVPNPFISETSIKGLDFPFSVNVYSSDGKKIFSSVINSLEENTLVNLEYLARGMYYFEVERLDEKTGIIGLKW